MAAGDSAEDLISLLISTLHISHPELAERLRADPERRHPALLPARFLNAVRDGTAALRTRDSSGDVGLGVPTTTRKSRKGRLDDHWAHNLPARLQ